MGNLLGTLYEVQKKDFIKTGQVFGEAFKDDSTFHDIFVNVEDDKRDAFFEGPAISMARLMLHPPRLKE